MSEQFNEQLRLVKSMEDTVEKVRIAESLVASAQRIGDKELELKARRELLHASVFSHHTDKIIPNFTWILSYTDKKTDFLSLLYVLAKYKWVITKLPEYSTISKEQIENIMSDMEKRFEAADQGLGPVYICNRFVYTSLGDPEKAEEYHLKFHENPDPTIISDCAACTLNSEVTYKMWKRNYGESINKATDLLNGKKSCKTIPNGTYPNILWCYIKLDELEKGVQYYKKYMNTKEPIANLYSYKKILCFLSVTKNFSLARDAFIEQFPYTYNLNADLQILEFYTGALVYMTALEQTSITEITFPSNIKIPVDHKDHVYKTTELTNYFDKHLDRLISAFDERNGNDYYSRNKNYTLDILSLSRKVPI